MGTHKKHLQHIFKENKEKFQYLFVCDYLQHIFKENKEKNQYYFVGKRSLSGALCTIDLITMMKINRLQWWKTMF